MPLPAAGWITLLLVSILAAHWGADRLSAPLAKLRERYGLSAVSGGAIIAMATASPEVGVNTSAAIRGVGDIGLGNLLGANILSVPLMVGIAYVARRTAPRAARESAAGDTDASSLGLAPEVVTVQAWPYVAVVAAVALLTLPEPWRGLQPIDGAIMALAYVAYMTQALLRGRSEPREERWQRRELLLAAAGFVAIAGGAWTTVVAAEQLVALFEIPAITAGLFITGPMSMVPEAFAAWAVVRAGQVQAGVTSVIADNIVTMTLALVPLAIVSAPLGGMTIYATNLAAVAVLAVLYALLAQFGGRQPEFRLSEVVLLWSAYAAYLVAMVLILWQ